MKYIKVSEDSMQRLLFVASIVKNYVTSVDQVVGSTLSDNIRKEAEGVVKILKYWKEKGENDEQ